MTETTQTEQPQCPRCGEGIRLKIHRSDHNQWKCKSCGKYFTFPQIKKTCPTCGKEFTVQFNRRQIYCCENCRPKNIIKIKTCPICKIEFQSARKYCSDACMQKASELAKQELRAERKALREKLPKIACLWCHDLFRPSLFGYQSPTCCPDCSYQFRKMRSRISKLDLPFSQEQAELAKLRVQGQGYKLPEVRP